MTSPCRPSSKRSAPTRAFVTSEIVPVIEKIGRDRIEVLLGLRKRAKAAGVWLPHMPKDWGGMGLGHVELAMVQAEAAKNRYGPWVFNCQAPDEGNMHTLLHCATEQQAEKYLRPLCEGRSWSCFAMTEPEVAGSDPTLIRTAAYHPDGDEWVINGHKWFISNAHRADFAILVARTEDDPDIPQAANSAFIIDLPHDGWTEVRQIETMHGSTGHTTGPPRLPPATCPSEGSDRPGAEGYVAAETASLRCGRIQANQNDANKIAADKNAVRPPQNQ